MMDDLLESLESEVDRIKIARWITDGAQIYISERHNKTTTIRDYFEAYLGIRYLENIERQRKLRGEFNGESNG